MMPGAVSAITPTAGGAGGEVMSTGKFGRGGPQIRAVGAEELQLPAVRRKSVLTLPAFYRMDNSPGEPLASPQEVQNVQAQMKGLWRPSDALRDSVEDKSARRDELERQRSILQRAQGRYEGAWLDKVDMKPGESAADALKRVEAELAETDRELAGQHWNYYAADNEEQLARLARQPESGTLYEQAGTAGAPDVVIGRVLSALQNGGAPEGDGAAVAQIRERFGVSPEKSGSTAQYMNDLTALLGTDLETRDVQTEAIGELKRRGYNYSRISGYERTRKEAEEYARKMEERQEAAREHPVLSSAASVLASPLQGLDFLDTALRSMGPNSDEKDLSSHVPLDPYAMEATNLVRTLRGTVAEEIEKNTGWEIAGRNAASFLYQTGMSVADSAAQIAAFGPAATYFMGASAASSQAQDIMARGGTNRQVLLGGLAAGAAEAVFEKFSIDHLLSARTVWGAKDLLRETLKQAGVEASEETFTEIANILSDAAIMGGSSGFNLAVRDYMAQGMSEKEARKRAYLDMVGQVAWAGAGGALSGAAMGGAVRGKQYLGGRLGGVELMPGAADTQREGRQKTASMGEAVGYTPMEADAIRYEGKTFRNIIAGIDSSVSAFFDKWRSGRKGKPDAKLEKLYLGKMDGETAAKVGDILGYEIGARDFIVTNDGVKHIMDTHGDAEGEIRKGNAPLTAAIIDALPDVVAHPDVVRPRNIEKSSPYRQGVIFEKMLPDGTAVYIQFDNSGRGTFEGRTLYVKEKESSSSGVNISEETHTSTSKTTEPELSSGTIIPQEGQGVKGKDARMAGAVFLPGAADTQTEGRQKTASTGDAGTYRAATPQNVELPTVPVINLSLDEVAQLNGGTLPQDGGHIRDTVIERARERLGLDRHSAAFIPASNVFRNGEEYVLKITKATLNKMFSVADGGPVPIESAAIMEHLERIANNGVYFKSEGDRKGRPQINGIDHLMTTVYIDGTPTLVDMRVRLVQQEKAGPTENVLYYFSPETITLTPKKGDGNTPAAERQAFRGEASPSPMDTIPRAGPGVKGKDARMVGAVFLPGSGLDAGDMGSYNGAKEAVGYGRGEGAAELRGVYGSDVRGEAQGVDAGGESPYQETGGGISEKRPAADWSKGHIVEQPLNQASVRAGERASSYIPDVYTVEDAALKKRSPGALAITSDGVIHLSDAIPEPLADAIGYHEVVHAVKQRGSAEYHAFLEDIGGRINPLSDKADEVLGVILRSRFGGKDLLDLSAGELKTAYDELSAVVWGFHKADPENARAKFAEVFTDFDGYIAELDAIMEGARGAYAEGGRTPPGGEGAALDAGERRALEEGWRDESPGGTGAALDAGEQRALEEGWRDEAPGVRAAGPYNGAKEAVSYGRGEEALTGLQGVPGADVRGGNPGADAGGAGGSKTVLGAISETARGTKSIPGWAEGHVVENPRNPAALRGTELAGAYIPDAIVVEDGVLKQQSPRALAMTSGGTICLSDAMEEDLVDIVSYHEVVHAVKQRGSAEYRAFLGDVGGRLNFQSPSLDFVLHTVRKSRFGERSFFDLSPTEVDTIFDELNALVWGHYKADPEHARAEFGGVFTDFDGYIAELDAIMEGARGAYAEGGRTPPGGEGAALDVGEQRALEEGWRDEEPGVRAAGRQKTASTGETAKPRLSMADFTDVNSPVWNNVKYGDTAAQSDITRRVHQEMVDEGAVVRVPDGTLEQVGQSYPDLRSMKKTERTPILRQKMTELKTALRSFLGGLKGGSFEFEVNGNILEAKLYDTGVREVMEKVNWEKASMLFHSDEVFQNARYLYSTPDYDGDPNIYRWNYFYTPVQIGDEVVGVRIAVRDMVPSADGAMDSQIYNWNIKKDTALDGGSSSTRPPSPGVSSAASSDTALDGGGRGQSRGSSGVSSAASSDTALDGGGPGLKPNTTGVSSAVSVDAPLDGGGGGQGRKSLGVSSGVSSDTIIPQAGEGVKGKDARMVGAVFLPGRPPDPTMEKRGLRAMDEEKKEPLTLEYFMEQMYGVKVEKKAYTPEEMERYRTRLREYAQEKAAQRAEKQSKDGQRDT